MVTSWITSSTTIFPLIKYFRTDACIAMQNHVAFSSEEAARRDFLFCFVYCISPKKRSLPSQSNQNYFIRLVTQLNIKFKLIIKGEKENLRICVIQKLIRLFNNTNTNNHCKYFTPNVNNDWNTDRTKAILYFGWVIFEVSSGGS